MVPQGPTTSLLQQQIQQIDEKHEDGHKRLRVDLTEGLNDVNAHLDSLDLKQRADHDLIVGLRATRERRKEISGTRAIIVAASVAGVFQLLIAIINLIARTR